MLEHWYGKWTLKFSVNTFSTVYSKEGFVQKNFLCACACACGFLIVCDLKPSKAGRQPKPGLQRPKQYQEPFWRIQIETAWRVADDCQDSGRRLEQTRKKVLVLADNSEYPWFFKLNFNYWYYSIYIRENLGRLYLRLTDCWLKFSIYSRKVTRSAIKI